MMILVMGLFREFMGFRNLRLHWRVLRSQLRHDGFLSSHWVDLEGFERREKEAGLDSTTSTLSTSRPCFPMRPLSHNFTPQTFTHLEEAPYTKRRNK